MLNVRDNFKQQYVNDINSLVCQKCPDKVLESQEHVINCGILKQKSSNKYDDIFSSNLKKVKAALTGYMMAWNERNESS